MRKNREMINYTFWKIGPILSLLLLWQFIATIIANPDILPSPISVLHTAFLLFKSGVIVEHLFMSLKRVIFSYLGAVVVAIPLGIIIGLYKPIEVFLKTPLNALRAIPALATIPVFLLIIGVGEKMTITVLLWSAFFPIVINTYGAVKTVNKIYVEVAQTMGANQFRILFDVIFMGAFPGILTGLRVGLFLSWATLIGAEMIGAPSGLGFYTLYQSRFLYSSHVMAGMVTIGMVGFIMDRGFEIIENNILKQRTT